MSNGQILRQIAILIDGGFFLRRLSKLGLADYEQQPSAIVAALRRLSRRHVTMLTGSQDRNWHRFIYRIFFYDALPYDGTAHHPLLNRQLDYDKSDVANARRALFEELKRERNVALRLGKVIRHDDWIVPTKRLKPLFPTRDFLANLDLDSVGDDGILRIDAEQLALAKRLKARWADLENRDVTLDLRQKGVDMRIGLDIAALTLKRFVNTIVLVSGDSDFVPAAKLARREGLQFILDPLWQQVNDDLFEHIDGLQSGLPKPMPKPVEQDTP
jgi:uncharacterized LabA/DUF88 family protein